MTSLEKAIDLGYLFLTFKPKKIRKNINTCTTFFYMYWYVSIYSEECFWHQYMYPKLSANNGYRWCPLGKFSHLWLEQLSAYLFGIMILSIIIHVWYWPDPLIHHKFNFSFQYYICFIWLTPSDLKIFWNTINGALKFILRSFYLLSSFTSMRELLVTRC